MNGLRGDLYKGEVTFVGIFFPEQTLLWLIFVLNGNRQLGPLYMYSQEGTAIYWQILLW